MRAVRWLIDCINVEVEHLMLGIPGSFNTELGSQARDTRYISKYLGALSLAFPSSYDMIA